MQKYEEYIASVHKLGRISGIVALIFIIAVPAITCWYFDVFPPLSRLLAGLSSILIIFIPISIIEVIMYTPMAGTGGSYLLFVTGNITNLRIPALMLALKTTGVTPASEEGEVISTITLASSALTTVIIIALGVFLLVPLTPLLNHPVLKPAFQNVLPALFGALIIQWLGSGSESPQLKMVLLPFIAATLILISMGGHAGSYTSLLIPLMVFISVVSARIMYKKGWLDNNPA